MAFQVEFKMADGEVIVLRGNKDLTLDICKWGRTKDPDNEGEFIPFLIPFKYPSDIPSAMMLILKMRVHKREIETMKELIDIFKEERERLHKEFEGIAVPYETKKRRRTT